MLLSATLLAKFALNSMHLQAQFCDSWAGFCAGMSDRTRCIMSPVSQLDLLTPSTLMHQEQLHIMLYIYICLQLFFHLCSRPRACWLRCCMTAAAVLSSLAEPYI